MDIFGTALLGFFREQSDALIKVIRDDGWEDEHSPSLYFEREPFDFEKPALHLVDGPTVDVGCGAGRHIRWLGANGHKAFGLDCSTGAVEVCRAQGLDNVELFDVMSDGIPKIPFSVRNISLFGNNVGIGGTFDGSKALFKTLNDTCSAGGQLVLTGINVRETDNPQHIAYQEKNVAEGRRRGEMRIRISYRGEIGPEFQWFHPEADEIEELGSLTGWKVQKMERIGGFFWASLIRS
ncbi:methyltransferase domain-containing protein [Actibacterium lipolyticum]|uniref:Methyltransferase type 11 domain-containing protein n=1 Tax=Actibacterium lipolyticum TaxID=1524263 RepID=A0A238JUT4_9RHOB|nr:methyltransferase domain-containing protein [Actibacterium lipolyticum]SMX34438.1 hypothetical protein COL8621_01309 [Actibacterium lipolyticum]